MPLSHRQAVSAGKKAGAAWQDPVTRRNRVAGMLRAWKRKERRENHHRAMVASYTSALRKQRSVEMKNAWQDKEHRANWLIVHDLAKQTSSYKRKMRKAGLRRYVAGELDFLGPNSTSYGPSKSQEIIFDRLC